MPKSAFQSVAVYARTTSNTANAHKIQVVKRDTAAASHMEVGK